MYRPELVDLKMTDRCYAGCPFCYQSSGPDGKHASSYVLHDIADTLKELAVFEAAFGGGEPMLHPYLFETADYFQERNVVPNVSTRAHDLLKYPAIRKLLSKKFGSVGISVSGRGEWDAIEPYVSEMGRSWNESRPLVHYVCFGAEQELVEMLAIEQPLLLLHPKDKGRGRGFYTEPDYKRVWKLINEYRDDQLSVDTMFAERLESHWDVEPRRYRTEDGVHSKYIDAVSLTVAKSSYKGKEYSFDNGRGYPDMDRLRELLTGEL